MPALPQHAAPSVRHNSQPLRRGLESPCCFKLRHPGCFGRLASTSSLCNAIETRNSIESSQEGVPNLIFCLFSIGEKFVMTLRNILVAQTSVCAHFAMADSDGHRLKRLCDNP